MKSNIRNGIQGAKSMKAGTKLYAGLAVIGVIILVSSVVRADTLYSYDPSQTYGGHSWSSSSDALASQFTLPTAAGDYILEELRIRISYTNVAITPITICIWANDNGRPGNLIWSQNELDINGATTDANSYWWWNIFDLSGANLALPSGSVLFAGYTSSYFADIAPSWSADTNMDGIQGSWYRSASTGQWSSKTYDRKMQLDVVPEPVIEALIDIDPDTLNRKSHGKWITVYITSPDGFDVGTVDTSSIAITSLIGGTCDPQYAQEADLSFTPQVGDRDEDGILDLTVKFDCQVLLSNLCLNDVSITIEGELTTGELFSGTDSIRIIER